MRRLLFFLIFTMLVIPAGLAQNLSWHRYESWPASRDSLPGHIDIVTQTEPTVRHRCRVHQVTPDSITCGVGIGHKAVTYKRSDVIALIELPTHSGLIIPLAIAGAAVVMLAGSYFVPITPLVIAMRVIGGLSLYISAFMNMADSGDHNGDLLVYQQPGTTLEVKLRS